MMWASCCMDKLKKKEYYIKNRDKRLTYQKEYYKINRKLIERRKELKRAEDPNWAERQRQYNKNYYSRNKDRIKKQRSEFKRSKNALSKKLDAQKT